MRREFKNLKAAAESWLVDEQGYGGDYTVILSADMRYRGQSFEIETILAEDAVTSGDPAPIAEAFHRTHERHYGHADRGASIQIINLRLTIAGTTLKPPPPLVRVAEGEAKREKTVRWLSTDVRHSWRDRPSPDRRSSCRTTRRPTFHRAVASPLTISATFASGRMASESRDHD